MRYFFLLCLFPLPTFAQQDFSPQEITRWKSEAAHVTIIRDQWGVPHIYGHTDADAVFGLLYAQCEENFQRVEENNLEMLGRLSELHGPSYLFADLQMKLIYDSAAAIRDYNNSPAWFKKLLDASADGVNYFLYRHPEIVPAVLHRFQPWYQLMRTDGSISATQMGNIRSDEIRKFYGEKENGKMAYVDIPFAPSEPSGSNGFAVGPRKTLSANSILYINPHVTFYFRTEMHMNSDEGLNVYGAVTWGQFFIYQGFNEHCGWMHTSSYADVADAYEETIDAKDPTFYLYDHHLKKIGTKKIRIAYKNENGTWAERVFTTYYTQHGPVLAKRNEKWISLKEHNRSLTSLLQSWLRTKAKSFEEFKKVMDLRANNSNNTVFASDHGHIAYWHGNFMPRRDPRYDWTGAVDGSNPATEWKGLHTVNETVHIYDPSSGYIENCNSTPFTASGSSSPQQRNYPAYMAPDGQNFRALSAAALLEKTNQITIEKMISEVGYDHYLAAFDSLLPPLFAAFNEASPGDDLKKSLASPIECLSAWNKYASDTSIATTLAIEWAYRLRSKAPAARSSESSSDIVALVQAMVKNSSGHEKLLFLADVITVLEQKFGSWKIAWGKINRYQRTEGQVFSDTEKSFAVGLAPGTWGCIPSFSGDYFPGTKLRYGTSGNSFVACVEFGKKLRARTVITGGQSFHKDSIHFTDQVNNYIQGNFKEVLFYKADVLKAAVRTYRLDE